MRRGEFWLAVAFGLVLALAAVVGKRRAPSEGWFDRRASTRLAGPYGAKGLAEILGRLGVSVHQWRRPLFELGDAVDRRQLVVLLDIFVPTRREIDVVRDYVGRGGRVLSAGYNGIEPCFGYRSRALGSERRETFDSTEAVPPERGWRLPALRRVLSRISADSLFGKAKRPLGGGEDGRCPPLFPARVDTLLTLRDGRPAALRLHFPSGGVVILVADVVLFTNQALKETDAGLVVLPWLLEGRPARVVVDEYHHGFGQQRRLDAATLGWLAQTPPGWAVLQLLAVALVALAVAAVRFGPALAAVERRRRSPLEHLDALAAGLERAAARDTAVMLLTGGLRRRLSRTGGAPRGRAPAGDLRAWLRSVLLAARTPTAQAAVRRLGRLTEERGSDEQVLATAHAVEDVWEALGQQAKLDASSTRSAASS